MPAPHNPYRDPKPFQLLIIGGRLFKCVLFAVNGLVIEDEYNVQRPIGQSGAVAVFKGTKIAEEIVMDLRAYNAAQYDELHDLCEVLKPAPGLAGGTGSTAPVAFTAAAQNPNGTSGTAATSSQDALGAVPGASGWPKNTTASPNPGPKPPTVTIDNAFFAAGSVFAVSRKKVGDWEWNREANYWSRKVTVIQAKKPTPANVGAQSTPKPGSQFVGSAQSPDGAANTPAQAKYDATRSPV